MEELTVEEEVGIIAIDMSDHLDAKEQAFFMAGFQEAIKYLKGVKRREMQNCLSSDELQEYIIWLTDRREDFCQSNCTLQKDMLRTDDTRFVEKSDCQLDTKTGFEWTRHNYGPMTWEEAMQFCINLEGHWGLPSIKELLSLVNYKKIDCATELPGIISEFYWSSTQDAEFKENAWHVHFDCGL